MDFSYVNVVASCARMETHSSVRETRTGSVCSWVRGNPRDNFREREPLYPISQVLRALKHNQNNGVFIVFIISSSRLLIHIGNLVGGGGTVLLVPTGPTLVYEILQWLLRVSGSLRYSLLNLFLNSAMFVIVLLTKKRCVIEYVLVYVVWFTSPHWICPGSTLFRCSNDRHHLYISCSFFQMIFFL